MPKTKAGGGRKLRAAIAALLESGAIAKDAAREISDALDSGRVPSARCMGCGKKSARLDNVCGSCSMTKTEAPREFWQDYIDFKSKTKIDLDTIRSVPGCGGSVPADGAAAGQTEV